MSPIIYTSDEDLGGKVFFLIWTILVILIVFQNLKMPKSIRLSALIRKYGDVLFGH
jgi:hypothetical protein